MSGYKTFAVAGAGNIGKFIIDALLEKQAAGALASVTLLTRSSEGNDEYVAKGVKISTVDYDSPSSLESALSGIDVVISTISMTVLSAQDNLAVSAKAAGVKHFVSSEFGTKPDGSESLFAGKDAIYGKLKELGIPYTAFYTGLFTDMLLQPNLAMAFGLDFASGKFSIPGSGTALISWTSRPDIANFVARTLTELPKDKIEDRIFAIEGDRICFNQLIEDWTARIGKEVSVKHVPRSVFEEAQKKDPRSAFPNYILKMDAGKATTGDPDELANNELADWKPKKVVDTLLEIYAQ